MGGCGHRKGRCVSRLVLGCRLRSPPRSLGACASPPPAARCHAMNVRLRLPCTSPCSCLGSGLPTADAAAGVPWAPAGGRALSLTLAPAADPARRSTPPPQMPRSTQVHRSICAPLVNGRSHGRRLQHSSTRPIMQGSQPSLVKYDNPVLVNSSKDNKSKSRSPKKVASCSVDLAPRPRQQDASPCEHGKPVIMRLSNTCRVPQRETRSQARRRKTFSTPSCLPGEARRWRWLQPACCM